MSESSSYGPLDRSWQPTWALIRSFVLAVAGPLFAVAFHRPDALVASAPIVIVAAWSVLTRPSGTLQARQWLGRRSVREGEGLSMRCEVDASPGTQEISVAYRGHRFVRTRPGRGARIQRVNADGTPTVVGVVAQPTRWGHHGLGLGTLGALSTFGAYQWGPLVLEEFDLEVLPAAPVFDAKAPMPHPQGLVGVDRSARPGEGSEFSSIREFQLGDRLRRIHWPSSLRSRTLNVTATYADHDSQVVVVADAANDIGISGGIDGSPSTLDSTVRAAAALCEHYIRRGDRVGLQVVRSQTPAYIRASTGKLHLRMMLSALAATKTGGLLVAASAEDRDPPARLRVNPGAIVLMCSPLISQSTMERAIRLAARGLTLVVVDTLPRDLVLTDDDERGDVLTMLAWRIRLLEREVDTRAVAAAGIPVVPWRGPGSLDQVLRDVARRGRAPRMAQR
jgi:uncharacterized protein (DUF58 family)